MGTERDPDPLVSSRGDEPDDLPPATGDDPATAPGDDPAMAPGAEPLTEPAQPTPPASTRRSRRGRRRQSPNMLPAGRVRGGAERTFVRVIATGGIVGISVAIAAIMSSSNAQGWLVGLIVSVVSVVLAAVLWSSRVL
jgi:hypothetical protein